MSVERHAVDVAGGRLSLVLHLPDRGDRAPCVVACHGLSASKDSDKYLMLGDELPRAGFALARFDFRGCGESTGVESDTTIATRIADVDAVLARLADHPRLSRVFGLLGSSLGGFVALHVASRAHGERGRGADGRVGVGAVAGGAGVPGMSSDPRSGAPVSRSVFPSTRSSRIPSHGHGSPGHTGHPGPAGDGADPDAPVRPTSPFGVRAVVTWNAPAHLADLMDAEEAAQRPGIGVALIEEIALHQFDTTPAGIPRHLVVQGEMDDVVSLEHASVLHARAGEPCDLVIVSGGDHRLTEPAHRRQAVDVSIAWFRRFLHER